MRAKVALPPLKSYADYLTNNKLVNNTLPPTTARLSGIPASHKTNEVYFYIIAILFLWLALMRNFFSRYLVTLFRVFFNTSLRQNQLTDQLVQANLPSFLFNLFFFVSAGLYITLLVQSPANQEPRPLFLLGLFTLIVAGFYLIKFLSLRLAGWLTGGGKEADAYIFIIFLSNKIEGMLLLPFILLMAFAPSGIREVAVPVSLGLLGLAIITRYLRARSMLRGRIRMSAFHFVIYVVALEILPVAFIWRGLSSYLALKS